MRRLFGKPEVPAPVEPEEGAEPVDPEAEEVAALGDQALAHLTTLFEPVRGGECVHEPLAKWMVALLAPTDVELG